MPTQALNGVDFFYEDRGKGLPLVLLHGFPLSHAMWSAQMADLASTCRVIAPDFRGFGKSQSDQPFTVDSLAADVHGLLKAIGALPCVVAGLSMGGYVALAFARQFANDLKGLVLVDTRADGDSPQAKESRTKTIDLVRKQGPKAIADAMIPRLLAPGADEGRPELARSLRRMIEDNSAKTIEHALIALRDRPDSTPLLPTLKVPTLIVVGDGDQITPPDIAEGMHKAIPGAKLAVIRGAGHMTPIEQPIQVNQALRLFVSKIR
ncbi:alpha/beta fold hydrolase [Humisphaera borealis]|uniref:Alpha/beta fold hydrolase n=1 Tax=Humisphaera borealis TaxID=2807512 RepID=A0A7M2X2H2_9BACT|nr:alpha/beta fold hydrolase [Humisphaera borealis]QOV91622.1 alpha/beta fold hydrolase [Humisphaera borealis]